MSRTVAIIPARYASTRLPGKPLALIGDRPMVWHVYARAVKALGAANVVVATDNELIRHEVTRRGGNAVITSGVCANGTERCARALDFFGDDADVVIDIQGDEPFIKPDDIVRVADCFADPSVDIATLVRRFDATAGFESLFSPDRVKVTIDANGDALYFSRSIIPYVRDYDWSRWVDSTDFHIHVGTYGFRADVLRKVVALPPSSLEKAENLEQLRWIQNGWRIRTVLTESESVSVDTPADLEAARKHIEL